MSTNRQTVPNDTRVKVGHLVTGLVFLGLAGSWALHQAGVIGDVGVGWLMPVILVAAGAIGLLAMLAGSLRRNRPQAQQGQPEPGARHDEEPATGEVPDDRETTDDTLVIHEEEDR
jgi:hypothetical protein